MREEVKALEHHAHLRAHGRKLLALLWKEAPLDEDLAGVYRLKAVDRADEGGLARARGADHDQDLPLADLEVDVFEHVQLPVVLLDVAKLDDRGIGVCRSVGRCGLYAGRRGGYACLLV